MDRQSIHVIKKTQAELEQDLKNDVIAEREMGDTEDYRWMKAFMEKVEYLRQERLNVSSEYTQKKLAEKAGIGLSTYKDYLSGNSDNIKLKTAINIAHALRCKLSDLIDEGTIDRTH